MANILIDKNSDLKICDFGLAYQFKGNEEINQYGGTVTTMAPEVIKQENYRLMPDWWSVGIIIYQLMMLKDPFKEPLLKGDDQAREYEKRVCEMPIKFHDQTQAGRYSSDLKDLVMKLLDRNVKKRLGQELDGDY